MCAVKSKDWSKLMKIENQKQTQFLVKIILSATNKFVDLGRVSVRR